MATENTLGGRPYAQERGSLPCKCANPITVVCAAFAMVCCADVTVTNEPSVKVTSAATVAAANTSRILTEAQFLSAFGTPSFWIDAADRTGWTVDGASVTRIDDKAGSGRWVQSAAFSGTRYTTARVAPSLALDDGIGGGAYLSFPVNGNAGLVFSPEPGTESATYPNGSNDLQRVGTILVVMDSSVDGGGSLMGGGYGVMKLRNGNYGEMTGGLIWSRGSDDIANSAFKYMLPLLYTENKYASAVSSGKCRIWGSAAVSTMVGFSGTWDVISIRAAAADDLARLTWVGGSGQRIAEVVFYERILELDEICMAEAYLARKWFGIATPGQNGLSRLGSLAVSDSTTAKPWETGYDTVISVPEGETLELTSVTGGRGENSRLVKTGGGELRILDASGYAGEVRIEEGSLACDVRATPTSLPTNAYFHVDASAEGALAYDERGGVKYLSFWTNDTAVTYKSGNVAYPLTGLMPVYSSGNGAKILEDEMGEGLHVVDLGDGLSAASGGVHLKVVTDSTAAASLQSDLSLRGNTVIAVIGAQRGGGQLIEGPGSTGNFNRYRRAGGEDYTHGIITDGTYPAETPSKIWINGLPRKSNSGFESPDYQVVAIQADRGRFGFVGYHHNGTYRGGLRIAELAVYRRSLTDQELKDAQAYLTAKWFKRPLPGYAMTSESSMPSIGSLVVGGTATVHVAAGSALRVNSLSVDSGAVLSKMGEGTLKAVSARKSRGAKVYTKEGSMVRADAPDVSAKCEIAAMPALQVDASATDSMVLDESGDKRLVVYWNDVGHRNHLIPTAEGLKPYLDGDTLLAGKATVNFGERGSRSTARSLKFNAPIESIRAVYAVVRFYSSAACLFGAYPTYEWVRGNNGEISYSGSEHCRAVYDAEVHIDGGSATNGSVVVDNDSFHLVEIHTPSPAMASYLTLDRGGYGNREGGISLAELVVYSRKLTEREKVATRNALLKKWFGRNEGELDDLPAAPASREGEPLNIETKGYIIVFR